MNYGECFALSVTAQLTTYRQGKAKEKEEKKKREYCKPPPL